MKKKKKKILKQVLKPEWYQKLIVDLKKIQFETIVKGKWTIGKRILEEKENIEDKTFDEISKDTGISKTEIFNCYQFAKKFDSVEQFIDKSWRYIVHRILPDPDKKRKGTIIDEDSDLKKLNSYDENMYHLTQTIDKEFDDDILCIDITHGPDDIRIYKEYYPTVLHVCTFVDKNGKEFSLRKYAEVQDFPYNFKFVGTRDEIKRQIGEAVDPIMSEYILTKYIVGKKYIELFAGCGGFTVGAEKLGKKCIWCNDVNRYSGLSFKMNFPETEVNINDIKKLDEKKIHNKIGDVDFIMGGPPCQGFSLAGKRKLEFKTDKRNSLYLDFVRFVKEFKPKQFIMENVPMIINYKEDIIKDFEKEGYEIIVEKVNGLDIGMKQKRNRVFFIGNKKEEKKDGRYA